MPQETRCTETAQEEYKKRLLEKLEAFRVIAAQAMRTCEMIEKELRGEHN